MARRSAYAITVVVIASAVWLGTINAATATEVYSNDFEGAVGSEWSDAMTSTTPVGARRFLGDFHNSASVLSLHSLPPHSAVTVEFDLYVIYSWDGNELLSIFQVQGPDIFEFGADGGTLIRTTFSNINEVTAVFPQAWPGDISFDSSERVEADGLRDGDVFLLKGSAIGDEGDHLPYTGSSEINSLGYSLDSVYEISATFPHTATTLQLRFSALLSGSVDETWGIDNISVSLNTPIILSSAADSFLRPSPRNANEGANPNLMVDRSRTVVGFDQTAIDDFINSPFGINTATLVLSIVGNAHKWVSSGGDVNVYPLLEDFTEGNGQQLGVPRALRTRGFGEGVTWNCATDDDISNRKRDCAASWKGGAFDPATADPVLHTNGLTGEVMWDVTDDVLAGSTGWLIKKTNEKKKGEVSYYSKEGAADEENPDLAPRLILE